MGKYISGYMTCRIEFHDLYVDEGNNHLDAIFPDGWEGEMTEDDIVITEEYEG